MNDSLGSSLRYPLSPCCKHYANSTENGVYNDTTLRQIQELSEEYYIRVVEALDTWMNWQGRVGGSAEYDRRIKIISEETREQLQSLVGSRIPKIEDGLLWAFAEALKGYRAPSRSQSRSRSRWPHPTAHNNEFEQA